MDGTIVILAKIWWQISAGLIVWRLTALLVLEAGPLDIFARFRDLIGVKYDERSRCTGNALARLFCCFWCTSLWVSIFVVMPFPPYGGLHDVLVVSALAIGADSFIRRGSTPNGTR